MKAEVMVSSDVVRSPRVMQVEGIFDVPPSERVELRWSVDLPIEDRPWNVGLIVGPSGCGKSTVARKLFPTELDRGFDWPEDRALLDAFPAHMGVKEVVELLSSVGFSSPPAWVRPFRVLSNGEQFRVSLARLLAEMPELAVVDEFTSVVDRTVAQVGSCALAKTVRRRGQKFVAVTCHEDVEEWLQPDWVYRPAEQRFVWRLLRRRPPIELKIQRVHHSAWRLFKHHHYLTQDINRAATCFVAFWRDRPVAFDAWLPFVGRIRGGTRARRGHRTVCLPDYQGVGIGGALFSFCASLWKGQGYRAFSATAHPAEIANRLRTGLWRMTRAPSHTSTERVDGRTTRLVVNRALLNRTRASARLTASFEYIGPALDREKGLDILDTWALCR